MENTSENNTNEKIWTRHFACLLASLLLLSCSNYYMMASISEYAHILGASGILAGIITSSFFFGSLFMRLINGQMVQKFGAYKMMLTGAILCVLACFCHYFAGVILLIIVRTVQGIGLSIFTTAGNVAASCLVPKKKITEGMGYYTLGFVLAMSAAPSLALTVVSSHTQEAYKVLFIISTITALISLLTIRLSKCSKMNNTELFHISYDFSFKHLPKTFMGFEKGVVLPAIISFMMTFAYSPAIIYLMGYGASKGWMNVGVTFVFYSIGLFSTRLTTGKIADRLGPDFIMYPAYFLGISALLIIGHASSFIMLAIGMLLLGMCVGAYNPEIIVFCIKRCTKFRRGTASSAFNGSSDLGFAAGSIVFGLVAAHFGYVKVFNTSALICMAACIIYFLTLSNKCKS